MRPMLVLLAIVIFCFQNCGQMSATRSDKNRNDLLTSHSIFGADNVYKNPEFGSGSPAPAPAPAPVGAEGPVVLPIKRLCQNGDSSKFYWWKYKYVSVVEGNTGLIIRIEKNGQVLCELTGDNAKAQIVAGQVSLPAACLGGMSKDVFMSQLAYTDRTLPIKFLVYVMKDTELVQINDPWKKKDGAPFRQHDPSWVFLDKEQSNPNCDAKYSPLFVDMRNIREWDNLSRLSSPANGLQFDILGDYPKPPFAARQKIQISWFVDPKLMFLALPDAFGRVNGVNELFGDNTKGPDGDRADHGFHALSKWDGFVPPSESGIGNSRVADGVIDSQDWVFGRLRFWSDLNRNAIAEPLELYYLKNLGITRIELKYDSNYREMDRYGNEVMFKSVVVKRDGTLNMLFDLWFNLPK